MARLSSNAVLRIVNGVAIVLSQAYQLARARLAAAGSPILRLLVQQDRTMTEVELLRRELMILRTQREQMPPHRRPDYQPEQRLAILQMHRLRGWNIAKTAQRFVIHANTLRSWIKAVEGRANVRLFAGAVVWNRIDDAVRWAAHELRRLCPNPEFGTRTIARHLVRAGIAVSRSTVQRVLRESKPASPPRTAKPAMPPPMGEEPHHLLTPTYANRVWHMDMTHIRILWFHFTLAAILDGFSRKLLCLRVYSKTSLSRDMARLVRHAARKYGTPRFLITDHGTQFRNFFHNTLIQMCIRHVKGRVRTPYLNGKIERFFRTFKIWWRVVLTGLTQRNIQRHLDSYRHWHNHHRPHSALRGLTPNEAWSGDSLPKPIHFRERDTNRPQIRLRRLRCHGDPTLPVIDITIRRAA